VGDARLGAGGSLPLAESPLASRPAPKRRDSASVAAGISRALAELADHLAAAIAAARIETAGAS
jgi:hypothetical protein